MATYSSTIADGVDLSRREHLHTLCVSKIAGQLFVEVLSKETASAGCVGTRPPPVRRTRGVRRGRSGLASAAGAPRSRRINKYIRQYGSTATPSGTARVCCAPGDRPDGLVRRRPSREEVRLVVVASASECAPRHPGRVMRAVPARLTVVIVGCGAGRGDVVRDVR
jgi:hypothetical protein